jgi:hypothetical protein
VSVSTPLSTSAACTVCLQSLRQQTARLSRATQYKCCLHCLPAIASPANCALISRHSVQVLPAPSACNRFAGKLRAYLALLRTSAACTVCLQSLRRETARLSRATQYKCCLHCLLAIASPGNCALISRSLRSFAFLCIRVSYTRNNPSWKATQREMGGGWFQFNSLIRQFRARKLPRA